VTVLAVVKQVRSLAKCNLCFEPRPSVVLTVDCGDRRVEIVICVKCLAEMLEKLKSTM